MAFTVSAFILLLLVLPALNCTVVAPTEAELSCNSSVFSCNVTLETGRYANPSDPTCKSYLYCYFWSNDRVVEYKYTCAFGIFNPYTRACDILYKCHCSTNPSTTEVTTTTAVVTTTTMPTTTSRKDTCAVGTNFSCTATGRYANPDDSTCKTYLYCYTWISGQTSHYVYSCAIGLFNPTSQLCDYNYVCPCNNDESTTASSSTTVSSTSLITTLNPEVCAVGTNVSCSITGRYASPYDTTCKSYIYCYLYSNGTIGRFEYSCSIGLFNPITQSCDLLYTCPCSGETTLSSVTETASTSTTITSTLPNSDVCALGINFTCSITGRFASPTDSTCKSYIYCYLYSNGTVGQFGYDCSIGLFNPSTQSCDLSYVCPCNEETTTSSVPETSSTITSTSSNSEVCAVGTNFSCSVTGQFASPTDGTCKSYIYCYLYSNGTVGQFRYDCSIGLFNPSTQSCDLSYVCPCNEETTTSSVPETSSIATITSTSSNSEVCAVGTNFSCSVTGQFASPTDATCKSYIYCYLYSNGTVGQFGYDCSIGLFNPSTQSCDLSYVCPCNDETTTSSVPETSSTTTVTSTSSNYEVCAVGTNFSCSVTGQFASPTDGTCKSYIYCYLYSNGTVGQFGYDCSIGLFNPMTQSCDLSYVCPCNEETTTSSVTDTSSTATITSTSSSSEVCAVGTNFSCSVAGRFASPTDSTCKSYIYCYLYSNGTDGQFGYDCSIGLFNPSTQSCDLSYVCPCNEETTTSLVTETSTTTTTVTSTSSNSEVCAVGTNFSCSVTGQFASPTDGTCKSYIYCYLYSNGTVGQFGYDCSIGLFNPMTQSCDLSYVCPCNEETTTSSVTDTSSTATITSTSSSSEVCAVGTNFSCSVAGRFASPTDSTCKSYIYCYLYSNGTDGQFGYDCSIGLFNPSTQSCDLSYVCPCNEETTTSLVTETSTTTTTVTSTSSNSEVCAVGTNFSCSVTGQFASPTDGTCKSYIYCYLYSNGTVGQFGYDCSIGLFNPSTQSCDLSYVCPCNEETTTSSVTDTSSTATITSTSSSSEVCAVGTNFSCSVAGRFASPTDSTCKSYIYCYLYSNGTVGQFGYDCSIGLFNPSTQSCDLSYVCPCNQETSTSSVTSETSSTATITSTSSNSEVCAVGTNFSCSVTGRFASSTDNTCKSYIYCYRYSNGTLGQFIYDCSVGLFNPNTQSCDLSYVCPCKDEATV